MPNTLNQSLSKLSYAPSNRYRVMIMGPNGSPPDRMDETHCIKANLPGRSFSTTDYILGNAPATKVPYRPTYTGGLNLTFRCDPAMKIHTYFNDWHKLIYTDSCEFEYFDDYVGTVLIWTEGRDGQLGAMVTINQAYPVTINPIDLGYDNNNTFATLTIEMAYRDWTA